MLITIKTLSGRKLSLDFDNTQKISDIKEALTEKEGIPVQQIRLIYGGKILKDEITIQEANIAPGPTLMMMMHLKGGF